MNIMLDLETLGTDPGCVILSIGAVKFNAEGIVDRFYRRINPTSCTKVGLEIDAATVMWWLKQEEAPRKEVCEPGIDITDALNVFSMWFTAEGAGNLIWGNGASFDNAILSAAYKATGVAKPYRSHNERCYRTIKNLYNDIKMKRTGTLHNALDDAESQALHLIEMLGPSLEDYTL